MDHLHWRHLLAITPATVTSVFTCLGHLGRCNTDYFYFLSCHPVKTALSQSFFNIENVFCASKCVAQSIYCHSVNSGCCWHYRAKLLPMLTQLNGLNTNLYSYLETCGGKSSNQYFSVLHFFSTSVNQTSVAA